MSSPFCEVELRCIAEPGSDVAECKKAAVKLAIDEMRSVEFIHNERKYRVDVRSLLGTVSTVMPPNK